MAEQNPSIPNVPAVPPPPTALAQKYVKYMLGFGVSVAVGLAPYLGKVKLPLFSSLLSLIPLNIQTILLPLSSAIMGIIAVVIQWYAGDSITLDSLGKAFKRTLIFALVSFVILIGIHTLVVVQLEVPAANESVSFLVGFQRPIKPPCMSDVSDADCIKNHLTLDVTRIESFWGDKQVRIAKLALMLPYLAFTGAFGMMIGLLLLKDEARRNTANTATNLPHAV